MSDLDELLAHPVDEQRRTGRSLPATLFGVWLPVTTSCGIVSRSAQQTADAVEGARRRVGDRLGHLTDADVVWLLLNGWEPARWVTRPGDLQHRSGPDCPCGPVQHPSGAWDHR